MSLVGVRDIIGTTRENSSIYAYDHIIRIFASTAKKIPQDYNYYNYVKGNLEKAYGHDILWQVMQIVMNSSEKVPFFSLKRFGLRKINQCFLKDIQLLNEYFEPAHFRVFRLPEDIVTTNKVMQLKDSFECGEYNVNLVRTIIKGEIQGEKAYQLNYDADIYLMDEEHIEELLREEKTINQMNKILFDLYKDAVTEKFLNQLIDGTFEQNVILGVDANEDDRV